MSLARNLSKLAALLNGNGQVTVSGLVSDADFTINGLRVGKGAGSVSTNTAFGYQAINSGSSSGGFNVAVGYQSMVANTTGAGNSSFGYGSLAANTTGSNNFAGGLNSLLSNTTGGSNTAIGRDALGSNTTASNNTAVGFQSLYTSTTATRNVAVGYQAGYTTNNSYNVYVGWLAGKLNTGDSNVVVGDNAMSASGAGSASVAIGQAALQSNTSGSYNTAVGTNALAYNTTASNNTAMGYQAGYNNTVGIGNTHIGYQAGFTNGVGNNYNTFIGYQAGYNAARTSGNALNTAVGYAAGIALTNGYYNTFIGPASGSAVTTGYNNTIIGGFSGNQGGLDIRALNNYIVLSDGDGNPWLYHNSSTGLNLRGSDTSDTSGIAFRNSATTKYWGIATNYADFFIADADFSHYARVSQNFTAWSFGSDRRIKKNIADISYGLAEIMAIQPRQFDYIASGKHDIGFIAQELQSVIPEAITGSEIEFSDSDTPQERASKTMGVSKDILIPVLVKAIQELKAEFDAYKEAHP